MSNAANFSIVAERNFILAAREVGYRSPADAVAELIDNSIQALAKTVHIFVEEEHQREIGGVRISVLDDGHGMKAETLRHALRFGGTDRFGDRSGLGRFGMGLPSSSVSQARRVEVYSWTNPASIFRCYLDVDEVASGRMRMVPSPFRARLPEGPAGHAAQTGTHVVWSKCDRIGFKTATGVEQTIRKNIGRMFRHFIWSGVKIFINDSLVKPMDPLFCHATSPLSGATEYGAPLVYAKGEL